MAAAMRSMEIVGDRRGADRHCNPAAGLRQQKVSTHAPRRRVAVAREDGLARQHRCPTLLGAATLRLARQCLLIFAVATPKCEVRRQLRGLSLPSAMVSAIGALACSTANLSLSEAWRRPVQRRVLSATNAPISAAAVSLPVAPGRLHHSSSSAAVNGNGDDLCMDVNDKNIVVQFKYVTWQLQAALTNLPHNCFQISDEVQEEVDLVRGQLKREMEKKGALDLNIFFKTS
ncbi:hypothetical protein ZWY2020_010257 [Hordeum vulgare]|nr:hypothetical protein ZWY2020_010257 [Hordeum vulgare]